MSGIGSGYLSGNMLVAFPFEDGQCLLWSIDDKLRLQQALERCFVDAGVSISCHDIPDDEWPKIGCFVVSDSEMSCQLAVGDDIVDFSVSSNSKELFPIVYGKRKWGSYVIVVSSRGIADFLSICQELSVSPPVPNNSSAERGGDFWLRLCPRCVTFCPVGLTSLRVYDGVKSRDEGPHFILTGDVKIKPGNNVQFSAPDNIENGIELNAEPGAGFGRVACVCKESLGGNPELSGPSGHLRLFNDTCYDVEVGEKYTNDDGLETQDLRIHAKCTACCTCAMYESIVNERLSPLADAVRAAMRDIKYLHESYESAVRRFNERISHPTLLDVTLTLSGTPIGANVSPNIRNSNVTGKMSRCTFTALVRNSSFSDIMVKVSSMSGTDSVIEAVASWSDKSGEPKETISDSSSGVLGQTYTICPGRSLSVTYVTEKNAKMSKVETGGFYGKFAVDLSYSTPDGLTKSIGRLRRNVQV